MKTRKERVSTGELLPLLECMADQLADLISSKENFLKRAPAGRLRLSMRKNQVQWFQVGWGTSSHGTYIPVEERPHASALAQKEYDRKVLPLLRRYLSILDKLIALNRKNVFESLYLAMHPGRRELVDSVYVPDEIWADRWMKIPYRGKSVDDSAPEICTLRGERVRSKSEAMIADTLYRLKIPYKYECPIQVREPGRGRSRVVDIFPDFTCLNVRLRREYLWEHFGLMDDDEYVSQVAWKMNCYEANGFFMGRNLILSMETARYPLDATKIERLAKQFLL